MLPRTLSTSVLTASTSALALILLTACGGEDAAEAEPGSTADADTSADTDTGEPAGVEESTEPIPASSEGPAQNWPEPEVPEEIYEETEEGAEALLHYWWEVLDYSRATGDTDLLESISTDECLFCEDQVEKVRALFDDNDGWWVGEPPAVRESFTRLDEAEWASSVFVLNEVDFDVYLDGEYAGPGEEALSGVTWRGHYVFHEGAWAMEELYVVNPEQVENLESEL